MAPLLTRMQQQHAQIQSHMGDLENARAELAAILDNMSEGLILLDKEDKIVSLNKSAGRIFDVIPPVAVGLNLLSVSRDPDLHTLVEKAMAGQRSDITLRRKDRHYQIFASPVMKSKALYGTVLLMVDVTDRLAAEESRREFTANVSHELKTPLTSISGFAEIIRDGIAKPQDVQHFAGMIFKESSRLMTLVNDILDLSQLDEKKNLGERQPISLRPMAETLIHDFAAPA